MTHRQEFRAYMKAANHTSGNCEERHLSETQMIALCRGEISAAERESVESHLVGCEQCIALFRSARDFLEPARADEEDVTASDTSRAWQSLWKRAQTASSSAVESVAHPDSERPHPRKGDFDWRAAWWRPALAFAVLALIAAGLIYFFSGKPAKRPPEIVHEESPSPAPSAPPVDQPTTTAQDGTTPAPNPPRQAPSPAGEEVLAMNIKARPGTGFEDSATRGEREDAARASLLAERKIYLEVGGDKRWRGSLSDRLGQRLRASGRLAPTSNRGEAEVALKVVVEAAPRAGIDATLDQGISFTARVVGADGKTLWPLTPRIIARRYQGEARKAADRMINDLLDDIQRLERKRP
jgi:hypothetical protein